MMIYVSEEALKVGAEKGNHKRKLHWKRYFSLLWNDWKLNTNSVIFDDEGVRAVLWFAANLNKFFRDIF